MISTRSMLRHTWARGIGVAFGLWVLAAPATAGGLPSFNDVPEPSWTANPLRAPDEILSRPEHPDAASWVCLDQPASEPFTVGHEYLIRLSVALEAARSPRVTVLEARAAAVAAGEPVLWWLADEFDRMADGDPVLAAEGRRPDWLSDQIDPLSAALAAPEREAWLRWTQLLPPAGTCRDDVASITDRAAAVASMIQQQDVAFLQTRSTLETLIMNGRVSAATATGSEATRLVAELDEALRELAAAEHAWVPPYTVIIELAEGAALDRGLDAAARAVFLQQIAEDLSDSSDPRASAAARLISQAALKAATTAGLAVPDLIVERPGMFDLEFAAEDSPRRVAVANLTASLSEQLPRLEKLYAVRTMREVAFEAIAPLAADPTRRALLQQGEMLWYRLAHASRTLDRADLEAWRRGWAWAEIGTVRDQLIPLEAALARLEQEALWTVSDEAKSFDAAVEQQWRILEEISALSAAETPDLEALQHASEALIAPAADATEQIAGAVARLLPDGADGSGRVALTIARGVLRDRAAILGQAESLSLELRSARPEGVAAPTPSFRDAAMTLAGARDLERLLASRDDAEWAVSGISRLPAGPGQDLMTLEAAVLLDLPAAAIRQQGAITVAFGIAEAAWSVTLPLDKGEDSGAVQAAWRQPRPGPGIGRRWSGNVFAASASHHGGFGSRPRTPGVVLVNTAPPAVRPFGMQGPTMPQGWVDQQNEARKNFGSTLGWQLAGAAADNAGSYIVGGTLIVAGTLTGVLPLAAVGGGIVIWNAGADVVTASAKAVNQVAGSPDPRQRERIDRQIDNARWGWDMCSIAWGSVFPGIRAAKIATLIDIGKKGAGLLPTQPSPPTPPSDPYLKRIQRADEAIQKAFEAAKRCDWTEARRLIDIARAEDPHEQSKKWNPIGYRVIELAYLWNGDVDSARDTLALIRERAHNAVYGCSPEAATLPVQLAKEYKNLARWVCDTDFDREMAALGKLGERLGELENNLAIAEASCDRDEVKSYATQVVTWAGGPGGRYECAPAMQASANKLLAWASGPADMAIQQLTEIRETINRCELGRAEDLLGQVATATRCAGNDLAPGVLDDTRKDLQRLIDERRADTARLKEIEGLVDPLIEVCDVPRMESVLREIEGLQACDGERPGSEGVGSRQNEIVNRLEGAIRFASEGAIESIHEVRELFNQSVATADSACDMQPARMTFERAASLLDDLMASVCAQQTYATEIAELAPHREYVEGLIDARDMAVARVMADLASADVIYTQALRSCSEPELERAAALLAAAADGVDAALPIRTDASCTDIERDRQLMLDLHDEALTLPRLWPGIPQDLASARQAAAEGREIGIDVHCAALRQKAHPTSCFASELAECDRLVPTDQPFGGGGSTVVPPPVPPPPLPVPSGGGGSARVQVDDPEPCARDMSWSPVNQRFECTCTGYSFDNALERCVPGATTVAAVTQGTCDTQYPGTRLGTDPETGLPACLCPPGTAWSGTHNRCLDLTITGGGPATRTRCDATLGLMYDSRTGGCECTRGTFVNGRCVDTAAADRQRAVQDQQKAADCEQLYSQIQTFRRNPDRLYQQQAAAAESRARSMGCDTGRIDQAVERGDRPAPWHTASSDGGDTEGAGQPGSGAAEVGGSGVRMDCASCSSHGRWLTSNEALCQRYASWSPSTCGNDPECARWSQECRQRRQARQMCVAVCPPGSDASTTATGTGTGREGSSTGETPPDCSHCEVHMDWLIENSGPCGYHGNRLPSICELDPECLQWNERCAQKRRAHGDCLARCQGGG